MIFAKDEVLLNFILEHTRNLCNNIIDRYFVFEGFFGFCYALYCTRKSTNLVTIYIYCFAANTLEYLFNNPYLEFILPHLEYYATESESMFACCSSVLSQYVRHGIETRKTAKFRYRFFFSRAHDFLPNITMSWYFLQRIFDVTG